MYQSKGSKQLEKWVLKNGQSPYPMGFKQSPFLLLQTRYQLVEQQIEKKTREVVIHYV